MQKNKNTSPAFTLVELIVVITILSVLSTIGFLSFQGYGINSRDAVRLSDMSNIVKGLSVGLSKGERLPIPEDKIDITASGTILTYQGYAGQQILGQIGVQGDGVDPLDESFYTYATNRGLNLFQILGYFEQEQEFSVSQLGNTTFADLSERYPQVQGDEIGILIDSVSKEPVQETGTDLDVVNTINEYTIFMNEVSSITLSGNEIFSYLYIKNESIATNNDLAQFDESLVLYLDMESTIDQSGWKKIRDFSLYNNHGRCFSNGNQDCGINQNGIAIVDGVKGKAMHFQGDIANQFTRHEDSDSLNILTNEVSMTGWMKLDTPVEESVNRYPIFLIKRPWEVGGYAAHFDSDKGTLNIQYCIDGGSGVLNYEGGIPVGEWFHYVGVKSLDILKIYINGKLVTEKGLQETAIMGSSEGSPLTVGSNFFQGAIDEVRVYNRVLNADEVYSLYSDNK